MEHKMTFKDYNEALKNNRLLGQKCGSCGSVITPPRIACRQCGSYDLSAIDLKGSGRIQSFTVINVPPEGRQTEVPYIVVMVELNEGPWIMGNLSGVRPDDVTMDIIGQPVIMGKSITVSDKYSGGEVAGPVFILQAS
jgi:uncharacterized protein